MNRRILRHILFWTVYFGLCLYNELYISPTFLLNPTRELFLQVSSSVLLLILIKASVVYFIIYKLIPFWKENRNVYQFATYTLLSILLGAFMVRVAMKLIIWPLVYEDSGPDLTAFAWAARYIYSLLDLSQVAGVAISIKLYKLNVETIRAESKLQIEKNLSELRQLKSQTNPHFLFNTLNSLYALARAKSDKASEAIMNLSKILRYTLFESSKDLVFIEDEVKIIRDYIELQQLRYAGRISIELYVDVEYPRARITPLLLLPLMENAYKHCDEDCAIIYFRLSISGGVLSLKITNPVSPEKTQSNGTGLNNLKRQLNLLYKDYWYAYGIENGEFDFELNINLNSYTNYEMLNS